MKAEKASAAILPCHRATQYPRRRSPTGNITRRTRRESPQSSSAGPFGRAVPQELIAAAQREREIRDAEREKEANGLYESEYMDDVREYMGAFQEKTMASVTLIDQQPELEWFMRPYLVDFIVEIHEQYGLRPETLYLTLNILDRYVSKRIVFKKHYQLVGCAAFWIAAKYEDQKDRIPTVQELSAVCCHAYEETAFIQMEGHVLTTIEWSIGHPTAEAWLRLVCAGDYWEDFKTQCVARFLMELTLFRRDYIHFRPRDIACAALLLSRFILGKHRRATDENEEVLQIVQLIDRQLGEALDQVSIALVRKYGQKFRAHASSVVRQWYLNGRRFDYADWSRTTPERHGRRRRRASSATTSPSSSLGLISSLSDSSMSSMESMTDFEDEIMTASTPLTRMSTVSASSISRASKENFPTTSSPRVGGAGKKGSLVSRPALSVLPHTTLA